MKKAKINLDIVLPELPDEQDACTRRIVRTLQQKKGIGDVHIVAGKDGGGRPQLCIHFNPAEWSASDVERLAISTGAEITSRYGHLFVTTMGIRHPRHARNIEADLLKERGITSASASGTGAVSVEFLREQIRQEEIKSLLKRKGLVIDPAAEFHTNSESVSKDHKAAGEPGESNADGHKHGGIFGERTELIFAILSGVFLAIGFGLSLISSIEPYIPITLYCCAYFFGGFYTTREAITRISKGSFEIDFLMLVAAVGAAILGQWAEGALLLFLFSLGHSLEHYAMEKARKSIAALTDLAPKTALRKENGDLREVGINELKTGDTIVIKPNSKISADGIVTRGDSSVNQAPITGESIPVDKFELKDRSIDISTVESVDKIHKVFAGSINGAGTLEVMVTKVAADSTIARLVKLVNEAQTQKSPTQNFTDKLEKYYVPAVLVLVGLLLFAFVVIDEPFSNSFYRAMAVLVAASPCALAISTPSAVLSGIARAARGGVLIKGGKPLEELGLLAAVAFDKTGTLTEGKPTLTGAHPLNNITEEELLEIAIAVEQLSDHPLAAAVVKGAREKLNKKVAPAAKVEAITGRGVKAEYNNMTVYIGNKELFTEKGHQLPDDLVSKIVAFEKTGYTTMLVQKGDTFAGILTLMDIPRKDARQTLEQLSEMGIKKMIMLTGDNQKVAEAIAKQIGITDAMGSLMPEQKVAAIERLRMSEQKVAMVGDGVNDAPAMAKSTVGIAMGAAGSDVALETADIALMADRLGNLPFAIGLSKKASAIIRQNLVISLGMVALLIPLTMLGIAHMGPAVIGHEGSTLVVVLNALRLLAYKKSEKQTL